MGQPQSLLSCSFLHFRMKLSRKLFGLAFVATALLNGEDENLVDKAKDILGDGTLVTEFLNEFISDYATCWIEWDELHGYRGDSNEDLRIAYEALTETMVLETGSSDSTTTTSATFGSDERAKYEEECNKIEGTVFWDYPDTTLTCEHDEGSTTTTVAKFADCYPDSEACNSLDEKGDAINEGLLKVLWQRGHKCTFDGGPDWASGEDVSSSSENPYDPSYKDDLNTTGDDEALVNAEDEDLVDEVKDAVIAEDENLVDPVKDVLGDGSSVTEFLSEFISDYATCWIEWDELHGYRGDSNEDLRIAYEALTETMVLETDSSNSPPTTSAPFGSDERAKYE